MDFLVGIDEAGRGPLAGPVAVGVAVTRVDFDWSLIEGVGDSKKISPKKRAVIFKRAKELKKAGELDSRTPTTSRNQHATQRLHAESASLCAG